MSLLRRHLYAGLVDGRAWGVSIRPGKHEGMISVGTFERVQQRLDGGVYAPSRKDFKVDFPLRGAVACSCCGKPLTAGWCKGKYRKYSYYFCRTKGCDQSSMIPRDKIESDFRELLDHVQPAGRLIKAAQAMFRNYWTCQAATAADTLQTLKRQIKEVEGQISKLADRIVEASNPRVVLAMEKRVDDLERQQLVLRERAAGNGRPVHTFDEMFELSMRFLSSPCFLWDSGRFDLRRLVLRLVFSEHLTYSK